MRNAVQQLNNYRFACQFTLYYFVLFSTVKVVYRDKYFRRILCHESCVKQFAWCLVVNFVLNKVVS